MKAFITGASGFIGGRVARKLLQRGDQVVALVRSSQDAAELQAAGAQVVFGDITERESLRAGMHGCDIVYHTAGWYQIGSSDWTLAEAVNVQGTRNVLGLAFELGIPKIIYTSSVAVYGDTHGVLATESTPLPTDGNFKTIYDLTKWMAQREAEQLIAAGAPIIIVMPGVVFGPGDTSYVGDLMTAWYRGLLPVMLGSEFTITMAHVEDMATGHLLAAEKGRPGERYILAGPCINMRELLELCSDITGRPAPRLYIPARFVKPLAPLLIGLARWTPLRRLVSRDSLALLQATYTADSSKARQELGWQPGSLIEGLRETFEWQALGLASEQPALVRQRRTAAVALASAITLLAFWLIRRRRT